MVECRTPEREVRGSRPTSAVLCPWARHFTPRKYWLLTQEAMAPSRHDWKIVDWDVKPQHNQPTSYSFLLIVLKFCRCLCMEWRCACCFDYFSHFFCFVNLLVVSFFSHEMLSKCMDNGCLVGATPPTVFFQLFWKFADVFSMEWICACGFGIILWYFFLSLSPIFRYLFVFLLR